MCSARARRVAIRLYFAFLLAGAGTASVALVQYPDRGPHNEHLQFVPANVRPSDVTASYTSTPGGR